jgi:hypothetical protein
MKAGVSTGPCGVMNTPARARPAVATMENENGAAVAVRDPVM